MDIKRIEDIDLEIRKNATDMKFADARRAEKLKNRNATLRQWKIYLESNPREEMLKEQLRGLEERLERINGRYREWARTNACKYKNPESAYSTAMGVGAINTQINTLKELLEVQ